MKRVLIPLFMLVALASAARSFAGINFGAQYRIRGESFTNLDFSDTLYDANFDGDITVADRNDAMQFYEQRARFWANLTAGDGVNFKFTLQDTRTWGTELTSFAGGPASTGANGNSPAIHESYLRIENFFGAPITFKIGRQELAYGDERLVGPFDWSNGRSFDAIKLSYPTDSFDMDVFTAKIVENAARTEANAFFNGGQKDSDEDFYGVYTTVKTIPSNTLDLYALFLRDGAGGAYNGGITNNSTFSSIPATDAQHLETYGIRLKGQVARVDYTFEYDMQRGKMPSELITYHIAADAYAAKVGYAFSDVYGLRIGAEYDFASGDDDLTDKNNTDINTDSNIETFSNLFPSNHDKLGLMDQQAWRNVKAWNVNISARPSPKLSIRLDYWNFELAEQGDNWYGANNWNGGLSSNFIEGGQTYVRRACGWCTTKVGGEIDLTLDYKYSDAIGIAAGYSLFMPGGFIEDKLAASDNADWAYVQLTANF